MNDWLDRISPIPRHCGYLPFSHGVINPWRIIYDYELFMFKDGEAKFIIKDEEIVCPAPFYVIIPPNTKHISYCSSNDVKVYWCHFDWSWENASKGKKVTYDVGATDHVKCQIPEYIPRKLLFGEVGDLHVFSVHETMCRYANSNIIQENRLARTFYLQELLYLLDDPSKQLNSVDLDAQIALKVRHCLDQLTRMPFSKMTPVKEALEQLGQSYYHQERIFKREYHITPYQYLNAVRVEQVKELLGNSSSSVSEIAYSLGFDDLAYFSRYFRNHTGMSPRKYRQQKY